jgi:hypothetical protein
MVFLDSDLAYHSDSSFIVNPLNPPNTTYHHQGILVNGRDLICNNSQIDTCVKECARQFPLIDQQECVNAVEAKWAPYSTCFPGTASVCLRSNRGKVELRDLRLGDEVLDSSMKFVKVVGWLHRETTFKAEFLEIVHACGTITVAPDHLLYCYDAGDYVPAKNVRSLETLFIDGSMVPSKIVSVKKRDISGIFAPLTSSGSLLVDGVNASCYSSPSELPFRITQKGGQLALLPYRWLDASLLPNLEAYCRSLYAVFAS